MLLVLAAALLVAGGLQPDPPDRAEAERLARAGRTADAIALYERIVELAPHDVEARLWVARLALRLGRVDEADAAFSAVLSERPDDVDARIGLAMVQTRNGAWRDALAILEQTEADVGQNADLAGALARAYRRGGDERRALEYFRRAKALSPRDPDLQLGYEAVARTYGHRLAVQGFTQNGPPGSSIDTAMVSGALRLRPSLFVEGGVRTQQGDGYSEVLAGAGAEWRAGGSTTVSARTFAGADNLVLPRYDVSGEVVHYGNPMEVGGGVRWLSFDGAEVTAVSPLFAWNRQDHLRLDARYTLSHSAFADTGQTSVDHSVFTRGTWQAWSRAALLVTYAYGIESFEDLTSDRLGSLGATTLAAGLRVDLRSLTRITVTYEHQWRSSQTEINRVTISVGQAIP